MAKTSKPKWGPFKTKNVFAVGYSKTKNKNKKQETNGDTFAAFATTRVNLAYDYGISGDHAKAPFAIKTPNLSYAGANGRLKKHGRVLLFDKDQFDSEQQALDKGQYMVIKQVAMLQPTKGKSK